MSTDTKALLTEIDRQCLALVSRRQLADSFEIGQSAIRRVPLTPHAVYLDLNSYDMLAHGQHIRDGRLLYRNLPVYRVLEESHHILVQGI